MLFDDILKAQETFEEEFCGEDPVDSYRKQFIQLLDLPAHSSMEDVFNYTRSLVEQTQKLVSTINSFNTKTS